MKKTLLLGIILLGLTQPVMATNVAVPRETSAVQNEKDTVNEVGQDLTKLADDMENRNNMVQDTFSNMFQDISEADDGKVAEKTSKVASSLYALLIQFARVFIIMGVLAITVPDILCLLIPSFEMYFGAKNSGGGSLDGGNKKQKFCLLSSDYYAVAGGGTSSGNLDEGGGNKKGNTHNKLSAYFKLHMKTLVFALLLIIIFMTPMGFALIQFLCGLFIKILLALFRVIGGALSV